MFSLWRFRLLLHFAWLQEIFLLICCSASIPTFSCKLCCCVFLCCQNKSHCAAWTSSGLFYNSTLNMVDKHMQTYVQSLAIQTQYLEHMVARALPVPEHLVAIGWRQENNAWR
ncbi:hypothetical protein MTO96_015101 [Rhipicephalus appendiculatus]